MTTGPQADELIEAVRGGKFVSFNVWSTQEADRTVDEINAKLEMRNQRFIFYPRSREFWIEGGGMILVCAGEEGKGDKPTLIFGDDE